jgi:hypothetical protein
MGLRPQTGGARAGHVAERHTEILYCIVSEERTLL